MRIKNTKGFTLIEILIAVLIVGILAAVALPSYQAHIKKASRAAAETQLIQLASLQEKIFLNSTGYSASLTGNYTGTAAGGLGLATANSTDGKYVFTIANDAAVPPQTFTITATPVAGTTQAGDGNLSIDQSGKQLWNGNHW